ncbi:proline-rich protein HaeIII subfamily 1-like [Anoplophora glabripennis]|uniref:proline-rich protein HaeIII subfamily 1-like n=1 Tax=Anoplophora glabripennis TaxID=217634 RepID=UPI0008741B45|nr:proline-rich protein HaeIII subfamily 1-like [Anoplophora glabripennis]
MEPSPCLPGTPPQVPLRTSLLDSEPTCCRSEPDLSQGSSPATEAVSLPDPGPIVESPGCRSPCRRPQPHFYGGRPSQCRIATTDRLPGRSENLRPAPPGNPINDDVSSDEEDEMPPPEAAEAEDQGLDDLHPGRPIEPAAPQVGAQDQDGLHLGRLIKPTSQPGRQPTHHGRPTLRRLQALAMLGHMHISNPRASHHPLIKPTSQPGRQPTDHGRVQRLDDDRPPCPRIAYPEATPGPSHARPHAENKPPSQPPPAVGGPTKRPAQHFPGHLDIRRKRRPLRMVAISPPPTKRTQQPRPHERPGMSANPQQSQLAASRTTGAASVGQPPPQCQRHSNIN